jgi:hypothetical protein
MANELLWSGANQYVVAPTLGNILTTTTLRFEFDSLFRQFFLTTGYIVSQAGDTAGLREFGLFISGGTLNLNWGGSTTNGLLSVAEINSEFGGTTIDADVAIEFNVSASTYLIFSGGSSSAFKSGSFTAGSSRIDGMLFRLGGRSDSDTPSSTSGTVTSASGSVSGNTRIYKNGILLRNYAADGIGSTWEELVSSSDGTLDNFPTDNSQWASYTPAVRTVTAPPIASGEEFGLAELVVGQVVVIVQEINSQEAFGSVVLINRQVLFPVSIISSEALGSAIVKLLRQNINIDSIPSVEEFGIILVTGGDNLLIPVDKRQTWNLVAQHLRSVGFTGADNDVIVDWLRSEGVVEGTHNDLWNEYLFQNGYIALTLADKYAAWRQNVITAAFTSSGVLTCSGTIRCSEIIPCGE